MSHRNAWMISATGMLLATLAIADPTAAAPNEKAPPSFAVIRAYAARPASVTSRRWLTIEPEQ